MTDREQNAGFFIVFRGKTLDGYDLGTIKKNLARLLKTTESKIERMFAGKSVVVKRNLDRETARKYALVLKKIGLICEIRDATPKPSETESAQKKSAHEPETMTCPKCNHRQTKAESCIYCGIVVAKFSKPSSPPAAPSKNEESSFAGKDTGYEETASFFDRLGQANEDEIKEVLRIVVAFAIGGFISGFVWGGVWRPGPDSGMVAAFVNFFIFGLWALLVSFGLLGSRNFGVAKTAKSCLAFGFLSGGLFIGLIFVVQSYVGKSNAILTGVHGDLASVSASMAILVFLVAFLIGGLVSAVASYRLSVIMKDGEVSLFDDVLVYAVAFLIVLIPYKFMGMTGATVSFEDQSPISKIANGDASKYAKGLLIDGFPEDVPIYKPSVVKSSGTLLESINAIIVTKDGLEKVVEFYKTALPDNKWEVGPLNYEEGGGYMELFGDKDETSLKIEARSDDDGTIIDISIISAKNNGEPSRLQLPKVP